MKPSAFNYPALLLVLVLTSGCTAAARGLDPPGERLPIFARGERAAATGFLVVAPDRGFQGNEEVRDAFEAFAGDYEARLVFVTDERTGPSLDRALAELGRSGVRRVVVLPLFLSASNPRLIEVRRLLDQQQPAADEQGGGRPAAPSLPVEFARVFGRSYLAVEILADRFRSLESTRGKRAIVVGYGAEDNRSHKTMAADMQRIAEQAACGFGFESVRALVWHASSLPPDEDRDRQDREALAGTAGGFEDVVVVPFHLGKKLDGMMSFTNLLRDRKPVGSRLVPGGVTPHPALTMWFAREARRHLLPHVDDLGVVFLAHGADFHWNERMRQAVRPLSGRYRIEFAFSMADQTLIERAIRRLEKRGARAIVVVRVFGLTSSFRTPVRRMLGLDVEDSHAAPAAVSARCGYAGGPPAPRIRSSALLATVGGLEADDLFARALVDRAREVSRDPSREVVLLVAHGSGDDGVNEHWLRVLEELAVKMRASGGDVFPAIHVATWREDWPEKRENGITRIRELLKQEIARGRRVIIVPARTTGRGWATHFLDGLNFSLATGFAPHPLFAKWFEQKIRQGAAMLHGEPPRLQTGTAADAGREAAGARRTY